MTIHQLPNGFGTGPQPNPMPIGAEQLVVLQHPPSLQMALDQPTLAEQLSKKPPRPEIPKKNKHLEEICRLKQQLSELQSDYDHVEDSFERMALDLDDAEQKLAFQTKELEEKEAELIGLRKTAASLSAQLDQEKQNQASIGEKLKEQDKSTQIQMQQEIESSHGGLEQKGVKESEDVSRLQAEVTRLTGAAAAREEELKNVELMAAQSQQSLTSQLHSQTARLEEQTKLRETAEAAVASQEQQATTGLVMAELRQLCDFYQENSQRLSKQISMGARKVGN